MKRGAHDLLLNKIYKEKRFKQTRENHQALYDLFKEGLIYEEKGRYWLTEQGEKVRILGFQTHKKSKQLEEQLLGYSPKKYKRTAREIILIFIILIGILILFIWFNFDDLYIK